MNEQRIIDFCQRLSMRHCLMNGISDDTWRYVRRHGCLPPQDRGPKENEALTTAILAYVKEKPYLSIARLANALGCSRAKVCRVLNEHSLNFLWQRLRYAGVELKELDPELVKARENPLYVDGPGALVHIDSKQYAYLKGGKKIVGMTVVDNDSGFIGFHLCPDGSKSGAHARDALTNFYHHFPASQFWRTLSSDNGSEFVNSTVLAWTESFNIRFKQCKANHAWSNGKAEVTQRLIKREIILPLLVQRHDESLEQLAVDRADCVQWFNFERPYFGKINRGLTPATVALETAGIGNDDEREEILRDLRRQMRYKNRIEWARVVSSSTETEG